MKRIVIIGGGPAGVGAAVVNKKKGHNVILIDRRESIGGMCGSYTINGFIFDRFTHVSYANDPEVLKLYSESCKSHEVEPIIYNFYKGKWLRHPVQYNLAKISCSEKLNCLISFILRDKKTSADNYKEYLETQYGKYFAKSFSLPYSDKYWHYSADKIETKWLGVRMYPVSIKQMLSGAFSQKETGKFYASMFYYPDEGGFASFYKNLLDGVDVHLNKTVTFINEKEKCVQCSDGCTIYYDELINTSPISELNKIMNIQDSIVSTAVENLNYTSGYTISIGLNKKPEANDSLFFYIYDKEILSARVHFPHIKSINNCPTGKFSMQIGVYTYKNNKLTPEQLDTVKKQVLNICKLNNNNVLFSDIKFEQFANIIFDHDIYKNRQIVLDYLKDKGIISIGRYGRWDYLWSFQSMRDGLNSVIDN